MVKNTVRNSQQSLGIALLLFVVLLLALAGCAPARRAVQRKACKICAGDSISAPVRVVVIERDTIAPQVVTNTRPALELLQWLRPGPGHQSDTLRIEDDNQGDGSGHILLVRHDTTISFVAVCDTIIRTDTVRVDTTVRVMLPAPPTRSWWEGTAGGLPLIRRFVVFLIVFPWCLVLGAAYWLFRRFRRNQELFKNPLTLFCNGKGNSKTDE